MFPSDGFFSCRGWTIEARCSPSVVSRFGGFVCSTPVQGNQSYVVWQKRLHKPKVRDKLLPFYHLGHLFPPLTHTLIAAKYPQGNCNEYLYETVRARSRFRLLVIFFFFCFVLAAVLRKKQCHASVLLCMCHGVTLHPKIWMLPW